MIIFFEKYFWQILISTGIIAAAIIFINNMRVKREMKCEECGKLGSLYKEKTEIVEVKSIAILVNTRKKSILRGSKGYPEQYVLGQETVYHDIYVCKHCGASYYRQYSVKIPGG